MPYAPSSLLIFCLMLLVACHDASPPPSAPAVATPAASLASTKTYTDSTSQISFQYPADWTPGHGKTAVVQLTSPDHNAQLSLDIPGLPFHFPGMITAGAVTNGYIDDLKKRLSDTIVVQNQDVSIPNASARRVKITGFDAGTPTTDFAVLIVHDDKVYILSSDGSGPNASRAAAALDGAIASLRWGK